MAKAILKHQRLIHVGKAEKAAIALWREGVSLEADSGVNIDSLLLYVAADRWKLAAQHRQHGDKLISLASPLYRSAISRFYYSMYHAMRAAAFVFHRGDDYQDHSTLYVNIPKDFPNAGTWQNSLKDARLARNAADYDPYPRSERHWRQHATAIQGDAVSLLNASRIYLRSKGCARI
jgi:uncharacterized protein (UPF0332 family)